MWLAGAVALIAAAVALRVAGLEERALFRDEAASWLESRYPLPELLARAAGEPYPPLYALLLHAWMPLFGDSEAALRWPSVLAGVGIVAVGWRWAHEALGRWPGLVALAVLSFSPLAISNARDARMYALEALFATVAWWLIWRLLAGRAGTQRRSRWIHGALLAGAVAGQLWTLSLGLVIAGFQGFVVLGALIAGRRDRATPRSSGPDAVPAFAALVLGGLTFAPWLPRALAAATSGDPFWTPRPGPIDWLLTWQVALVGWGGRTIENLAAAPLLLAALLGVVILLRSFDRERRWLGWVLVGGVALVVAVWAASLVRSVYDHRYFGAAVAPLALAVAAAVAGVIGRAGRSGRPVREGRHGRLETAAGVMAVVQACLLTAPFALTWLTGWRSPNDGSPVRELVRTIAPRLQPGDTLLAVDARAYFPLAYEVYRMGLVRPIAATPVLHWVSGEEPRYNGASLIDDALKVDDSTVRELGARAALRLGPQGRLWLIASSDEAGLELDIPLTRLPDVVRLDRLVLGSDRYEPAQALLIELPR